MRKLFFISILFAGLLSACTQDKKKETSGADSENGITLFTKEAFTSTIDGKAVSLYTLKAKEGGIVVQVTNFGARVVSLWAADKQGKFEDVVLGFDSIARYERVDGGERFFGPVVGRFANRIAKGQFEIDGVKYNVPVNNNGQSLHGGLKGLDLVVWNVDSVNENSIHLSYLSPDGEEGYPGNLKINITYTVTQDNELKMDYTAETDKPTFVNLSHHGLFNLKGEGNGTITDHILMINADRTTPVDAVLIPDGTLATVENTPFDFRTAKAIGKDINETNEQLKNGEGYDHNWVLNRNTESDVELVASLYEPASGRFMEILTDQPGLQFYSGNFFTGEVIGKYGKPLKYREGLALETQKFPDSPNQPSFPSTRLNPGEQYKQTCIYKFSTK